MVGEPVTWGDTIPRMSRHRLRTSALSAALLLAAGWSASPATALTPPSAVSPTDAVMAGLLDARTTVGFGSRFAGQVVDVESGEQVWARDPGWALRPASTAKLVTAANALTVLGPTYRVTTAVRRGTSWGQVVLVGGGDPSLSSADLRVLARTTVATLSAHRVSRVKLWFDDSLFAAPTRARGWLADDVPTDVRAVRALVVDEHHAADTSLDAARVFAADLTRAGIGVTAVGRGRAPFDAAPIATVRGDRLDVMVTQMLQTSDNDHAEALHRLVALAVGRPATWTGAALAQRSVAAEQGVVLGATQLYDGSGLSRSDRLTARQLVTLVTGALAPLSPSAPVARALPIAGLTGTLRASFGRFTTAPSRGAAGVVHAKTGTLDQAVTLAGWTTGADGRLKAFAFVVNDAGDSLTLKRRVDNLAATVTGCY